VPAASDLAAVASFYATVMDGITIQSRDGASRKTLRAVAEAAMAAWDSLIASRKSR